MNFESGRMSHILFTIFVPNTIGMIFLSLFLIADGLFVGKGVGGDAFFSVILHCRYIP